MGKEVKKVGIDKVEQICAWKVKGIVNGHYRICSVVGWGICGNVALVLAASARSQVWKSCLRMRGGGLVMMKELEGAHH